MAESSGSGAVPAGPGAVLELAGVGVCFDVPVDEIGSFKEYVLRRVAGGTVSTELWAVRGVDLVVHPGELVALVGSNGAGKSTLLKVVARVLTPDEGRVRVAGRVVPLLELGAGFHPDLTCRENVFLNASLLGHDSAWTEEAFASIMEFADLGRFGLLPVRQLSSGMVGRLGFATGTASRPDLLIVDEVLAVGDEAFQAKCLRRIRSFCARGTAVLLASHSEQAISSCDRALWLREGRVAALGRPREVLGAYRAAARPVAGWSEPAAPPTRGGLVAEVRGGASLGSAAGVGAASPEAVAPARPIDRDDASLVDGVKARCADVRSVFCAFELFAEVRQRALSAGLPLDRVLELGPGCNAGSLLCFLAGGSTRAVGVARQSNQRLDPAFVELMKQHLATVGGFGWWRRAVEVYDGERLTATGFWGDVDLAALAEAVELTPPNDDGRLPFPDEAFSVVYSLGSLAHHPAPERTLTECRRVLRPEGGMVHEIDLGHLGYDDPLAPLEDDSEAYATALAGRPDGFTFDEVPEEVAASDVYCNRWRASDYVAAMERAGFEVLVAQPLVRCAPQAVRRERLAEPFRSKGVGDLRTLVVRIVARTLKTSAASSASRAGGGAEPGR